MKTERFFVAVATTGFVLSAMPASAQDREAIIHACAGDVERLCAGVRPGDGRLLVAGFSNRANLSVSAVVTDFLMGIIYLTPSPI
jgi:hypothetical protein